MAWNPNAPGSTSQQDNQSASGGSNSLLASTTKTATGNAGSEVLQVGGSGSVGIEVIVTAVSGGSASMTLAVQWSNDGTNWAASDPADNFTAITAQTRVFKAVTGKAQFMRLAWTISGTTPSFTFSATAVRNT